MNNCNCRCNRIITPTSYTVGNSFNINTTFTDADLENGKRYILVLNKDLPAMTTIVPVYLQVNGTYYPMQDIIGNNLMSDQLRFFPRERSNCGCRSAGVARIVFGSNAGHFKVLICLPTSSAVVTEENEEVFAAKSKATVTTTKATAVKKSATVTEEKKEENKNV